MLDPTGGVGFLARPGPGYEASLANDGAFAGGRRHFQVLGRQLDSITLG
jgi:hypothetical protein